MISKIFKTTDFQKFGRSRPKNTADVYVSSAALNDAIRAAMLLGQPLLITGEPGTGKTTLGVRVASELHKISKGRFSSKPLFFSTKSTSVASDLFYNYDAIGHFKSVQIDGANAESKDSTQDISKFIKLEAFGKAILATDRKSLSDEPFLLDQLPSADQHGLPDCFVIVIDEIDKASRDFPNDLLHEIENYTFRIKEKGTEYYIAPETHLFVIMTSNSEKALPEAFLRRCIFFNIDFPDETILKDILQAHQVLYSVDMPDEDEYLVNCLRIFQKVRSFCKDKKPATAELINWVQYLVHYEFDFDQPDRTVLRSSLSVLVKSTQDMKLVEKESIL